MFVDGAQIAGGNMSVEFTRSAPSVEKQFERIRSLLARVDLSRFPIPLNVTVQKFTTGVGIFMNMHVADRDRPDWKRQVWNTLESQNVMEWGQREILRWVRDTAHNLITHELDECLLFDGRRVFDPHADDTMKVFDAAMKEMFG